MDSLSSLSHLTIHSTQRHDMCFWLRDHVVLFPAASFCSVDITSCFRPYVISVPFWPERVPDAYNVDVHSSCVVLLRQYNATASVYHFENCKSSQQCVPRSIEHQASRNARAASEAFLCVVYGERLTTVWMSRGILVNHCTTESVC